MSLSSTISEGLPRPAVSRRARSSKVTSRPAGPVTKKYSFYLSPELVRRLDVLVAMTDQDRSKALESILSESPALRRFVVSDRGKLPVSATCEVSSEGPVE